MQNTPPQKLAVSVKDAMAITGLSQSSIYNLFSNQTLTKLKAGSRTLIRYSDLENYINSLPEAA